jgi:aryl-alcohol dehydrogenase-like predicted oxidoreductase
MGRAMNQTNRSTQVGEARTCNLDGPKEPTQEPMRLGYRQPDTVPVSEAGRLSVIVWRPLCRGRCAGAVVQGAPSSRCADLNPAALLDDP